MVGSHVTEWAKARVFMAFLAIVTALGVAPMPAQAQHSFSSIVVDGNRRIETSTVLSYAAIPRNQSVSNAQLNDAYQRLVRSGLFEDVAVTPSGARLVIRVQEFPTINRINIEGNKRLKDDDLLALLGSQPRKVYSPTQAEADAVTLVEAYRQSGRFSAEVKPRIIRRSDNRVDLAFEVFEGDVVEIERLAFVGNRSFSDRKLRGVIATRQAGIFRRFVQADTFISDRLEFDKQLLRDFYLSRGYIDIQILSATAEVIPERNGFFVTFKLREGQSFTFGRLTTTTELDDVDAAEFDATLNIRNGVTYSPVLVERAIERMERLATSKGLSFIRVEPKITRHDDTRQLDLEFVISRGPRVFVERIDIEGNATTLDRVIRAQFKTVEGDPFNPREIRAAAERIRALGFFSNSDVQTRPGSREDTVIIDVDVEEQPTGSLSFGASYSSGTGIGATASLTERNFLGRGQDFRLTAGFGVTNQNYNFSLTEPNLLGRDLSATVGLYYRTTAKFQANYDTRSYGFEPSVKFPAGTLSNIELRYRLSSDTLNNVSGTDSIVITGDATTRSTSSVGYTYRYDSRTGGLDPRAGVLASFSQDVAGLGGETRYLKSVAKFGARRALLNEDYVLSAELEGGLILPFGGSTRVIDRFALDSDTLRGFQFKGVGPRDLGATGDDFVGGNRYVAARFEAQFPLFFPKEYGISGGLFYDIGSVWSLSSTTGTGATTIDDSMRLRSAIGISIFWDTPLGPLRFNFARAVTRQSYDLVQPFNLTLQSSF